MAEQGELLPERQVLKREIGAGSERSTRGSQESEYEGHCAQRRSASSRRPVSRSSFGKRQASDRKETAARNILCKRVSRIVLERAT
jgi:hypothetical protein